MSALFRIVYAAHANGTHHKLALDALNQLQNKDAETWRRLFLKNVEKYLEGSKAPDKTFKDFKNHVLHVSDNYWGGAPEKVEEWYFKTVDALRAEQWEDAVYSAGVLSHYVTDPVMPFHTGQTEAENAIHRATEWSINRTYDKLRKLGEEKFPSLAIAPRSGDGWQKQMCCDNAEYSHRYYEKLIAHYDINKGAVTPEAGLDSIGNTLIAELLIYAAETFSIFLDRAIKDAAVAAPDVSLTVETFLATVTIPRKWIEKKLSNAEDRKIVQAMYDELKATGRVDKTLTEDDRTVRDLHAAEVLASKNAERALRRAERFPGDKAADLTARVVKFEQAIDRTLPPRLVERAAETERRVKALLAAEPQKAPTIAPVATPAAAPVAEPKLTLASPVNEPAAAPKADDQKPVQQTPVQQKSSAQKPPEPAAKNEPEPPAEQPAPKADVVDLGKSRRAPQEATSYDTRTYLNDDDPLEDAPSIGPKMAERFADLGVITVGDFLGQDPHDLAELLDDNRFDADDLIDWQDQAQLVIDIPGLRGGGAQLLVGAGYRTVDAIADADPVDLSADVLAFATTAQGKRILRDGNPPDLEKVKAWVTSAQHALAA